jgi:hypothetical protein
MVFEVVTDLVIAVVVVLEKPRPRLRSVASTIPEMPDQPEDQHCRRYSEQA